MYSIPRFYRCYMLQNIQGPNKPKFKVAPRSREQRTLPQKQRLVRYTTNNTKLPAQHDW